jgi:hypothetical protein
MTRKMTYRKLGDGQKAVLSMGLEQPVTRQSLDSPGLKVALYGLKRLKLIDEQGRTTPTGQRALEEGHYPVEADPLEHDFASNVRTLMQAWKVKRLVAIRRAVAMAAKTIEDEQKGTS